MEPISSVETVLKDPENSKCVDCRKFPPKFVSINNGVFVCDHCKDSHMALGTEVSCLKQITEEALSSEDLACLTLSGNSRFIQFMDTYGTNSYPIKLKYLTVAADYYRRSVDYDRQGVQLKAMCEGKKIDVEPPDADEGAKVPQLVQEAEQAAQYRTG